MPRPQRYRDRQAAGGDTAVIEAPEKPEKQEAEAVLDNAKEVVQSPPANPVEDGDFITSLAKRTGWVPPDEFGRDPEKFKDARTWVENLPDQLVSYRDRVKRLDQVSELRANEARQEGIRQAEERLRAAVKTGDEDAAVKAHREGAQAADPQVTSWVQRNPWFATDPTAHAVAQVEAARIAKTGASVAEQLEGAERIVQQRFPEHFAPAEPKRETRLSDAKPAPQVAGGSRSAGGSTPKIKGWGDIPSADRQAMKKAFEARLMRKGLTKGEVETQLGVEYWRNQA